MEILREIVNKPQETVINDVYVLISNKNIEKNTEIELGGLQKKKYTVEQLAFFLMNKEMMYTQYLRKCKENNICPVFYTDQKVLLEELQKIKEDCPQYTFDTIDSLYTSKNDYSWINELFKEKIVHKKEHKTCVEPFRIIVPSSLASILNLSNIECFLKTGELKKTKFLVLDKLELVLKNKTFVAKDTITDWTSEDWKSLVGIFVDGTASQLNEWRIDDIASLFHKIPVFYLFEGDKDKGSAVDGYDVTRVVIKNGKCEENCLKTILNMILKVCNSQSNGF